MIVYILFSPGANIFYTGFTTETIDTRFERHQNNYYDHKFTRKNSDWEVFLTIACNSSAQARAIEKHIKKMKSRVYIQNLKKYPEMIDKLLLKYKASDS